MHIESSTSRDISTVKTIIKNNSSAAATAENESNKRVSTSYKTFDMVMKLLQNGTETNKFFERYGNGAQVTCPTVDAKTQAEDGKLSFKISNEPVQKIKKTEFTPIVSIKQKQTTVK